MSQPGRPIKVALITVGVCCALLVIGLPAAWIISGELSLVTDERVAKQAYARIKTPDFLQLQATNIRTSDFKRSLSVAYDTTESPQVLSRAVEQNFTAQGFATTGRASDNAFCAKVTAEAQACVFTNANQDAPVRMSIERD